MDFQIGDIFRDPETKKTHFELVGFVLAKYCPVAIPEETKMEWYLEFPGWEDDVLFYLKYPDDDRLRMSPAKWVTRSITNSSQPTIIPRSRESGLSVPNPDPALNDPTIMDEGWW